MQLSGKCLCGAVGYRLDGWVSRIQACHAERCRRATGGLFAFEIAADASRFAWTGDTGQIATWQAPILHAPPAYRRNFCRTCGAPLPVVVEGAGMVILDAGTLDDTTGLSVFRHAFTDQKSAASEIGAADAYPGQPPRPDPADILS